MNFQGPMQKSRIFRISGKVQSRRMNVKECGTTVVSFFDGLLYAPYKVEIFGVHEFQSRMEVTYSTLKSRPF